MKRICSALAAAAAETALPALASYHTFQIQEIFSNADGTIQYVVLHESLGADGENRLGGHTLTALDGGATRTYTFPTDLPGGSCDYYSCMAAPTAHRHVLIGTAGFAALGLVDPDYVVPNGFIPLSGTLDYAGVDVMAYASLPTDGVSAMNRSGDIVPNFATNFAGVSAAAAVAGVNYQGLWWNAPGGSEDGWGINLAHQGDAIFASWFTYDTNRKGWWLVAYATRTATNTYSGKLYATRGPAFSAVPWDPLAVAKTEMGTATLTFADANNGTFRYVIGAIDQTKTITREVFGTLPTCTFGSVADLATATNYQDLWWKKPANTESGWGINLNHEGDTIFATWFTYDLDGSPLWLVVAAPKTGPGVYAGDLYRTSGARYDAFKPGDVVKDAVGTATFTVVDGNTITFDYTVRLAGMTTPVVQSKAITREILAAPGTACR